LVVAPGDELYLQEKVTVSATDDAIAKDGSLAIGSLLVVDVALVRLGVHGEPVDELHRFPLRRDFSRLAFTRRLDDGPIGLARAALGEDRVQEGQGGGVPREKRATGNRHVQAMDGGGGEILARRVLPRSEGAGEDGAKILDPALRSFIASPIRLSTTMQFSSSWECAIDRILRSSEPPFL
jgi:hypothetical protein